MPADAAFITTAIGIRQVDVIDFARQAAQQVDFPPGGTDMGMARVEQHAKIRMTL